MKKQLIVNLDQDSDVLICASVVEQYKAEGNEVSLLTLASHGPTASSIQGINQVFLIQLDEILKYKKHRIFSDLEMVRELAANLLPIQNIEWDEVINISKSESAAYLVNCIPAKMIRGNRHTTNRTLFSDNDIGAWIGNKSLMSERARIQEITGLKNISVGSIMSSNNTSSNHANSLEIGIEINQPTSLNHLNQTTIIELVNSLNTLGYRAKILLTSGKNLEKFVYELNEKLSNNLEVIDLNANDFSHQISTLSLILTTSLRTKTSAEILGIKTISLWTDLDSLYRFRSGINSYNLFVNSEKLALLRGEILTNTIISCLNSNHQELMRLPEGVELYLTKEDDVLLPISYHYNQSYFLRSITEKALWRESHFQSWNDLKKYLNMISDKDLSNYIGREKDSLSLVAKTTLSAIRYLKNHTQGPNQVRELLNTLDHLMNKRVDGSTYFLLNLFKHRMDHLGAISKEENVLKTEKSLITLKNHLGCLTKILGDMAEIINERRKVPFSKNYQSV